MDDPGMELVAIVFACRLVKFLASLGVNPCLILYKLTAQVLVEFKTHRNLIIVQKGQQSMVYFDLQTYAQNQWL